MRFSAFDSLFLLAAAVLEVAGDAVIRKGMRGGGLLLIAVGFVMLGSYGIIVNLVKWDFSQLLGVYVAVFATVAVLVGRYLFREVIPASTWVGLVIIIAGAAVIQFGPSLVK
jgi:drug/metabolite transporter superfamily protein YnfA